MSNRFAAIFTTINAPYKTYVDEGRLVGCLLDIECAKKHSPQVGGFFGEVMLEEQVALARAHGISFEELKAIAFAFSEWSGAHFPPWMDD